MADKGSAGALEELLDREAIRELPLKYCHCVWQKDVDGFANLFTEDGAMSTSDPNLPHAQGRPALRKMIGSGLDTMKPRPFIHNHVIELLGPNRAKGTCYLEVRLFRDGKKFLISGWYDDDYEKVAGEWKFKNRRVTIDSSTPVAEN